MFLLGSFQHHLLHMCIHAGDWPQKINEASKHFRLLIFWNGVLMRLDLPNLKCA